MARVRYLERQHSRRTSATAVDHTHDDTYAGAEHEHGIDDVTGLQGVLDGKADWSHFPVMASVTGATVPDDYEAVSVLKRDAASLAAPYLMKNAGLVDPGHAWKAMVADGRYFEYAPDKIIDMTSIGASPSRTGAQNTAYYNEAVAYSLLRGKVPIFWPAGTYEHIGLQQTPDTTSTGERAVPVIGAGQRQTILRLANGADTTCMNFAGVGTLHLEGVTVCNLQIDGNRANQTTTSHGLRGSYLKHCLIRDVLIKDTNTYGIGFETGASFQECLFDHVTIIRAGADGVDFKNNEGNNRGIRFSNFTVIDANQLDAANEAAIDIRSQCELSNIWVYGPLRNGCIGIRFRSGDDPASDFGAPRSSLTNFHVYNPEPEEQGTGVQVLHRNVNISNGIVHGCAVGLWVVGSHCSVTNVQCLDQSNIGMTVSGREGRFFGVNVINPAVEGVSVGASANGNQFFGCTLRGGSTRAVTVASPITAACCAVGNITLSGEQAIDGFTTSASRVIVMGQTDKKTNGVYISAAGAWARDPLVDAMNELGAFSAKVSNGTHQYGKWFYCTNLLHNPEVAVGVEDIEFVEGGENRFFGGTLEASLLQGSQVYGTTGWRNEVRGTGIVLLGQTVVIVYHHMGRTPTQVVVTPLTPLGVVSKFWVDRTAWNNQYFYISVDVAAAANLEFAWIANS